jgi:atypical dual specificity phosphatase
MEQREARQEEEEEEERDAPAVPPGENDEERDRNLSSRVVSLLFGGDISAQTFEKWVSLVRKRSGAFRPSGFPRRNSRIEVMPSGSFSLFSAADLR